MDRFALAREVFEIEAQAILNLTLEDSFNQAVDLILANKGKIVVSGMGKSGIIGKKLAATLSSTGTPAFFLHPAEASHGDLGVISEEDLVVAISYGGGSAELDILLAYLQRKGVPLIAITGNLDSKLARNSQVVLSVRTEKEACPLNLAPTASSTASLAMCDALAMVLLREKGFKESDFAQFHPGGALGRKLLTRVKDVALSSGNLPLVKTQDSFSYLLEMMTTREVRGVCGVVDQSKSLVGVVTDGDVRRGMRKLIDQQESLESLKAGDLMSTNPKRINENELAQKALYLMEQFGVSSLFVMSNEEELVSILHIQDLLDAKIT